MYDPVPATGVYFTSTDTAMEGMVAHAAAMAPLNIKPFRKLPNGRNFSVMEEGWVFLFPCLFLLAFRFRCIPRTRVAAFDGLPL